MSLESLKAEIGTIGICGIGQMGSACAVAFRRAGFDVMLWARSPEKLASIDESLDAMDKWCDENFSDQETTVSVSQRGAIEKATQLEQLDEQCGTLLDCIIEVMDDKVGLLSRFKQAAQRDALFLSATSALSITAMAERSGLSSQLVGAHFWNPPHIIPVVEMVRGEKIPDAKVQLSCDLMKAIGKIPIVCKDVPGFVGNRLLHAMWREALHLVNEGVCSAEEVDRITKLTFALRLPTLGPIENMDYVGLDATERLQRYMGPRLASNTEPAECLTQKLADGDLGVKSGKGFYDWSERDIDEVIRKRDEQVVRQLAFLKEIGEIS